MHIGIDATALFGSYNGVEYALWNLLISLNEFDGKNNYTIYFPADGPHEELKVFSNRWRWIRLSFTGAQRARRIWWQQTQLATQLQKDGCDILHSPTYVAPLNASVPVVLTVYDLIALKQPHLAKRSNVWHYRVMLPRSIHKATRIIAPSDRVADDLAECRKEIAARTRVIPLGVEPLFFQKPTTQKLEEVRRHFNLPTKFLLFVGNFEPKKNLPTLLRALKQIPDAPPLVLAGGGRAWNSDVSTHNALSLGYVAREDLPVLYHLCEAFVFPSLAEGFGLPVLEALAAGAPVVTSMEVPLPNLQSVALLCEPLDESNLAKHIQRVLQDDDLRMKMKQSGPQYAASFLWRRTAEETLAVYCEAAGIR